MNFRRCRHVEISSFRLFNVVNSGLVMMKCFSVVHRLHRFVRLEKGFALARIFHLMVKRCSLPLTCQMCLLSSVSFLCVSLLNDT